MIKAKDGKIIGRACLLFDFHGERKVPEYGVVTAGGLRASVLSDFRTSIVGVLTGHPTSATRRSAVPTIDPEALASWASEQARLTEYRLHGRWDDGVAQAIRSLGGETGPLPIAFRNGPSRSIEGLRTWKGIPDEVVLIDNDYEFRNNRKSISLYQDVLAISFDSQSRGFLREIETFDSDSISGKWPLSEKVRLAARRELSKNTIYFAVIGALATAWHSTVEEVIASSDFSQKEMFVGKRGNRRFKAKADILRNPNKRQIRQ